MIQLRSNTPTLLETAKYCQNSRGETKIRRKENSLSRGQMNKTAVSQPQKPVFIANKTYKETIFTRGCVRLNKPDEKKTCQRMDLPKSECLKRYQVLCPEIQSQIRMSNNERLLRKRSKQRNARKRTNQTVRIKLQNK